MLGLGDVRGLWTRSLLAWPDGRRDETTSVSWLQGPTFYADLRCPENRPAFPAVSGRNTLTRDQIQWLATQDGFAGRLKFDGTYFEWQRAIDYQPASPSADAGKLWFEEGRMIEEGRDVPYIEHWHRAEQLADVPSGALQLAELETETKGFLVRSGELFMVARDRAVPLPRGGTLLDLVTGASLEQARVMVDCEISFGRIGPAGWIIERSSLPYRDGANLWPAMSGRDNRLTTADVTTDGAPLMRAWRMTDSEGDLALPGGLPPDVQTAPNSKPDSQNRSHN
jgi:hypothetical protein